MTLHKTRLLWIALVIYFWTFPVTANQTVSGWPTIGPAITSCGVSGYIITTGKLVNYDSHIFTVNGLTLLPHPDGVTVQMLSQYHGKNVVILIREIP